MLNIQSKMEIFAKTYAKDTGVEVLEGKNFCTDGKKIYIVPVTDQDDPWIRAMTEVGVYHETGHIVSKDFPTFASIKENAKRHTFNVVRDVAIEKMMCDKYPGMANKWADFLTKFVGEKINDEFANDQVKPLSKLLKLLYLRGREQQLGKDFGLKVPAPIQELFDKTMAPFMDRLTSHQKVKDSLTLTEDIQKAIKDQSTDPEPEEQPQPPPPPKGKQPKPEKGDGEPENGDDEEGQGGQPSDEEGDGEPSDEEGDGQPSDEKGDGQPSDEEGDGKGDGSGEPSDKEGDQDPSESKPGSSKPGKSEQLSDEAKEALKEMKESLEDPNFDDKTVSEIARDQVNEYAVSHKVYREKPGLVEDIQIAPERYNASQLIAGYEELGQKLLGNARGKLRTLLLSEKAPTWERNLKSGRLDNRKLWKVGVGSRDLCKRKTEGIFEDAVVYEVIDNSNSMEESNGGLTKAKIAQSVLTVMSADLDKLRIPFGAVGFTIDRVSRQSALDGQEGIRSMPCRLNVFKGLNEPFRKVRNRFVWPERTLMTAELPAIKYAANQLAGRRETKKVLFILTDGETCTGAWQLDIAMRKATKEYVDRLVRAGVKVVGIGIMSDSMKEYCTDFIPVWDLNNFGRDFYAKLTKLLL